MKKTLPANAALIPANAKPVFKGQIFDVWQWPQEMFDGSTETFEMLRRPDTVQVIVVRDQQILLVEDEQPGRSVRLHFPGGRVDDKDDSWLAAAQRELLEETGLSCADWRLIDVQQPAIKIEWFTPIFLAQNVTSEVAAQVDVAGEKIKPVWQDFTAVRERVLAGDEPTMVYLLPFFNHVESLAALVNHPEMTGETVDR
ncbi:MAG TPA: NUDIX domain-containing protein [Candidatus Saccharimonadales bacterium]|nr:NUDIX domain-containing protein [Candidatus Saccharimonadales bacterium]